LAQDNSLSVQVGANDNETIKINLRQITSNTLGLNGFNVNGGGTVNNRAATVSDLTAANADDTNAPDYVVTTKFEAVTAEQAFTKLNNGDKVTIAGGGTEYTYNASNNTFSYTETIDGTTVTAAAEAAKYVPASGTVSGTYT